MAPISMRKHSSSSWFQLFWLGGTISLLLHHPRGAVNLTSNADTGENGLAEAFTTGDVPLMLL